MKNRRERNMIDVADSVLARDDPSTETAPRPYLRAMKADPQGNDPHTFARPRAQLPSVIHEHGPAQSGLVAPPLPVVDMNPGTQGARRIDAPAQTASLLVHARLPEPDLLATPSDAAMGRAWAVARVAEVSEGRAQAAIIEHCRGGLKTGPAELREEWTVVAAHSAGRLRGVWS